VSTLREIADFSKVLILFGMSTLMSTLNAGVRSAAFEVRGTIQENPVDGTYSTHCPGFYLLASALRTPNLALRTLHPIAFAPRTPHVSRPPKAKEPRLDSGTAPHQRDLQRAAVPYFFVL
jgi:hypothetical protein